MLRLLLWRLAAVSAVVTERSSAHAAARFIGDPFRRHVALDERKAGSGIAPAVPLMLPHRALLLKYDGPRARHTAVTTSSEVVDDAPHSFMITGGRSSFIGRRLQRGGDDG